MSGLQGVNWGVKERVNEGVRELVRKRVNE